MTGDGQRPGGRADTARARNAREWTLLIVVLAALVAGGGFWLAGYTSLADLLWAAATAVAAIPALLWVVAALRQGRAGVDVIAVLALAGTLAVGEYLAGALIALMLATGRTLESYAERRASRDLHALLARAPRSARRRSAGGTVQVVALDEVRAGDRLVVGPGELVPVDGTVEDAAILDESALTGESLLVDRESGDAVGSGALNAGPAFGLRATATAEDSTYEGIVRLAREASAQGAPLVRLADKYAAAFLPLSLALAGLAWLISGQPVRAVAVLVVATPCPLLLATPIAIVSGLSRAARRGLVVRGGGALETLGRARTLLLDKTGTLTMGRPRVVETVAAPQTDRHQVLRLAAAVEQVSPHVLATAIVREAEQRDLALPPVGQVTEEPGVGVSGTVEGHQVRVGRIISALPEWTDRARQRAELENLAIAWVSVDGSTAGAILLHDPLRPDAARTVRRLRQAGFARLVMLTGDRTGPATEVARVLGLDEAAAQCTPAEKVRRARAESEHAVTVMVGDGINDAPALAAASVGIAMGARGATAAAEAADAVLTVDRVERLADAVQIARRSRRIAAQSAAVGMGLSLVAMGAAAVGLLPPAVGAFLQEGIDVLVIANALRALGGPALSPPLTPHTAALLQRFAAEHEHLREVLIDMRSTADTIAADPAAPGARQALEGIYHRLVAEILPHEHAEEHRLYPALATPLGSGEATATMSRAHVEIDRLAERIGAHLRLADGARLRSHQVPDLLATLYGLDAVLRLHFSQEEEHFFSLAAAEQLPAAEREHASVSGQT